MDSAKSTDKNKWRDYNKWCEDPAAIITFVCTSIGQHTTLGDESKEVKDFVDYQLNSLKRDIV